MATVLNPYITFPGTARQALEFYRDVLGGELSLHTFGEMGQAGSPDPDKLMHGMLTSESGLVLMANDAASGSEPKVGDHIAVSLSGEDEAVLTGYFQRLCAGGTVTVPLEKQMWGDVFGMCVDRFGIQWMVNIARPTG